GYADLFGNTSFCDCADCRSILSPAAYFVDLMHFIEGNITQPAFAGKPTHSLRLNQRRIDLWTLPLTCANTDTLVSQLTLVNEILQSYLTHSLGVADVPQPLLADRSAIGLPLHQPLEAVREYLRDWKLDLADVYERLRAPGDTILKEMLQLSDEEW